MKTCKNYHKHSPLTFSILALLFSLFFSLGFCVAQTEELTEQPKFFYFSTDVFGVGAIELKDSFFWGTSRVFGTFFTILFSVAGVLMVVLLTVYGTQLIYSQVTGNINKLIDAKKHIIDIAIGICLLLFSWVILNFVNPDILNPNILRELRGFKAGGNIQFPTN